MDSGDPNAGETRAAPEAPGTMDKELETLRFRNHSLTIRPAARRNWDADVGARPSPDINGFAIHVGEYSPHSHPVRLICGPLVHLHAHLSAY